MSTPERWSDPARPAAARERDDRVIPLPDRGEERSLAELFSELAVEVRTIVREEAHLATTELRERASVAGKSLTRLTIGAVLLGVAAFALVATLMILLDMLLPLWLSALLVTLGVGGVGYALVQGGLGAIKGVDLALRQTIRSLKEDLHG